MAFALAEPADTRLLLDFSRSHLLDAEPAGAVAGELAAVNAPVERAVRALAVRAFGTDSAWALERTNHAVIDLPLAVVRRHLLAGTLSDATAVTLRAAVRALLIDAGERPRRTP